MKQGLVIKTLLQAFEIVKEMGLSEDWESGYRVGGRRALEKISKSPMRNRIDRHLEGMARCGVADRKNKSFSRDLLTELGDIELSVPRTRRFSAGEVCGGLWKADGSGGSDDFVLFCIGTFDVSDIRSCRN